MHRRITLRPVEAGTNPNRKDKGMLRRSSRLFCLVALTAAVVGPTLALAGGKQQIAPQTVDGRPYLARVSGDEVVLAFRLDRDTIDVDVTIDGERADVDRVGPEQDNVFQAFAELDDAKPGQSYWIKLKAKSSKEAYLIRHSKLYLHQSLAANRD